MTILTGQGHGEQAVLGIAAHLRIERGRPTLSEEFLALLLERQRLEEGDLDTLLVADDATMALWMSLPTGANLAGVVGIRPRDASLTLPAFLAAVTGVEEARQAIPEGAVVLLDPLRGQVLVEPSAEEILRLQRARRPRFLVGAAHVPALTQGGLEIAVWGIAAEEEAIHAAVEAGADGLYLPGEPAIETLQRAAVAIGGGPVAFAAPLETAFALAAQAQVHWCLPAEAETAGLREELADRARRLAAGTGEQRALPRLAALLDGTARAAGFDEGLLLDGALPSDILSLPPLRVRVEDEDEAQRAVTGGAIGLLCRPGRIGAVKDAIRAVE